MIRIGNVRTVQAQAGETLIYVGRGRCPEGMEHARLGNPFVVGEHYAQGEAAAAYLEYLRQKCRERGAEYRTITALARRLAGGEALVLCCWCDPKPCHAQHIMTAVQAYAKRYGWKE